MVTTPAVQGSVQLWLLLVVPAKLMCNSNFADSAEPCSKGGNNKYIVQDIAARAA